MEASLSEDPLNSEFALQISNLTAVRGYSLLFSGLDFILSSGCFAALKGPNGTGKTTLLRIIAGFIEPETGNVSRAEEFRDQGPFFLGHEHGLRASETPLSHLKDWADMHFAPRDRISAAIERVGLTIRQNVPAYSLSAGQKKRVALARALVAPRKLWLLDEPASALDVHGQALLCDLMREHLGSGGSILAALHDPLELQPDTVLDLGEYAK
ncbi:heme ABC exporter ATP-binding protein CcmA [Ponticaulis koreensis]|uniref:heme ABC exporter ATP-binding protein CcmA n=1 Tax=Ponticaulis koreensis TaxID=1123045 RepID=UPI002D21E55B|nr:heme ABC exporter ATP-binding protein CcmA [Ponticaulis koreensis]